MGRLLRGMSFLLREVWFYLIFIFRGYHQMEIVHLLYCLFRYILVDILGGYFSMHPVCLNFPL